MPTGPAQAITRGMPDDGRHPNVGELLFHVPDEVDAHLKDPGSWFTRTGTLVDPTHVVTAGHCHGQIGPGRSLAVVTMATVPLSSASL